MSVLEDESAVRTNERGELVLSLAKLRPKPRWLELTGADGEIVTVKVPGNLSLQKMLDLRAIEARLQSDLSDAEALDELANLEKEFGSIILAENPGVDVELNLDSVQAVALFGFLARPHDDLATLWVDALTAGRGEKPDAASDDAHELARAGGLEEEDADAAPLPSTKRSSRRSSASARSTTGRRSGGSTRAARGKRSGSTSGTRSKSSASADET